MDKKKFKIIELYGLPGCGKSTLRDSLVNKPDKNGIFCLQSEMTKAILNTNFLILLIRIPYKTFWYLLRVILRLPKTRNLRIYRNLFMHAYSYHQAKYVKDYDYIVMDHGIIQSLISVLTGTQYRFNQKDIDRIHKLLNSIPHVTYVNCSITTETSLMRIRKRGRGHGRLDVIKDDSCLKEKLQLQYDQFNQIYDSMCNDSHQSIKLDMEQSIENITCQLTSIIA